MRGVACLPYEVGINDWQDVYVIIRHNEIKFVGKLGEVRERMKKFFEKQDAYFSLHFDAFLAPWSPGFQGVRIGYYTRK